MIGPLYPGLAAALTLWRCGGLSLLLTASLPERLEGRRRARRPAPLARLARRREGRT